MPATNDDRPIRILHLSDFHFTAGKAWDADPVFHALARFIAKEVNDGLSPDLVVITGDVAFAGVAEEYQLARAWLDEQLWPALPQDFPRDRLLLVPGNHDVDRKKVNLTAHAVQATLLSAGDQNQIAEILADAGQRDVLLKRHAAYLAFLSDWSGETQPLPWWQRSIEICGTRLYVAGLDSAWMACGDGDRGRLLQGRYQIHQTVLHSSADGADWRLALLHHPWDYFAEFDGHEARSTIHQHCDLLLRGHLHSPQTERVVPPDPSRACLELAAGCVYENSRYPNAFQWIELHCQPRRIKVLYRAWIQGAWAIDRNRPGCPDGEAWFNENFPKEQLVSEGANVRESLAAASVNLLKWEKTLPNGQWMERPERESIEARFQLDSSATVLLGEPGSGKSALLSKIASDLLERGAPVFALKADLLSTEVRAETDLQHELYLPATPNDLIRRLAALQPVYVLIDQLDALASQLDLRSERLNVLLNLVRRIGGVPNVHVLLSARTFEFDHDVRLRAIEAEAVTLTLPPWHEVKEQLVGVGIDPDAWPEKARDVVRIPQALKTFVTLARSGRTEPFTTYQAMLEQLWHDRIASADDSDRLGALASDLAGQMAEEEALWLAVSRFDDHLKALKRLEALGFIVRSDNNLSVAFSHQTVFDYVLARTFVRNTKLLSTYVLERQDSLFVRAKAWSALNYLRGTETISYEREFLAIWKRKDLRRHLRVLLIEFLGQVNQPLEFEKTCMAEALKSTELRMFGLKAIGSCSGWFVFFASTAIREAMSSTDSEVGQACRILSLNWRTDSGRVIQLVKERWLPNPEKDNYSWIVIHDCPLWSHEIEEIGSVILKRSPIGIWEVEHTAMTLAVEQPDAALRLVRAKLDFLLAEAKNRPEPPPFPADGTEGEKASWHVQHERVRKFQGLLDAMEWHDLPSLAEAAPVVFLQYLWPWYVAVFSEILACRDSESVEHVFPGHYILEIDLAPSEDRSASPEKPVMSALQIAVEKLAEKSPEGFLKWGSENSNRGMLAVQQLIARGHEVAADSLASEALEWLLLDQRRFQLGTTHGLRRTTINLARASAPHWSSEEIGRFETAVHSYDPQAPDHLKEPKRRKSFADTVRATKKDLLQAVGVERLGPKSRELVATEQRALGDRFDCSIGQIKGGFIGPPMEATAMAKAKDRDILKIFREIPDSTNWNHPSDWMRGSNIELSRAFAEFARTDPGRAIRLMEHFEPHQQERAAGYALDAMAEDAPNDSRVIEALLDLHARGFQAEEFRGSAARAVEKVAKRKVDVGDEVIDILVGWLGRTAVPAEDGDKDEDIEHTSSSNDEDLGETSILWGQHGFSSPDGNYNTLSALASILLNRKEAGRDRYLAILDDHLSRERNPDVWKALLYQLGNAGGSTPQGVSAFLRKLFGRFPEILATHEAVIFLGHAQRWDDQLVFDLISDWRTSDRVFLQRAYGELVGLVATVKAQDDWVHAQGEIIASGTKGAKIGLAHAAVNMWADETLRRRAGETLITLLKGASEELVATVMDIFRVIDEFVPDASTVELLRALAQPSTDMSAAPSHFVVERLQGLLPHEAELVATIAEKLVAAWRSKFENARTGTGLAASQLTDLALTLHRLGGTSRQSGIALFEAMIQIDAYGARETLAEIDGRFGPQQAAARQRLARRRKLRGQRGG